MAGSTDELPVSSKKSCKDSKVNEEILSLLRTGNERTLKTLELIDNTLSPDLKRSWFFWMETSAKEIDPSL